MVRGDGGGCEVEVVVEVEGGRRSSSRQGCCYGWAGMCMVRCGTVQCSAVQVQDNTMRSRVKEVSQREKRGESGDQRVSTGSACL